MHPSMGGTEGLAVVAVVVAAVSVAAAAAPPWGVGCTEELLSFSACLPYVSLAPNNMSDTPSVECCKGAMESACFCELLRHPNMLGFPLNTTRLLSLFSFCSATSISVNFLCSRIGIGIGGGDREGGMQGSESWNSGTSTQIRTLTMPMPMPILMVLVTVTLLFLHTTP